MLYGVFVSLRWRKHIKEVAPNKGATRTGSSVIPIVEPLPSHLAELTSNNRVILLEWQTNR